MTATIANPELLDKWAKAVGITNDHITRIVVDMKLDDVVRVYVEQWGDDKMNRVDLPCVDMQVVADCPDMKLDQIGPTGAP